MAAYSPGSAPAAFNLLAAAKRVLEGIGPVVYAESCLLDHDKVLCENNWNNWMAITCDLCDML